MGRKKYSGVVFGSDKKGGSRGMISHSVAF